VTVCSSVKTLVQRHEWLADLFSVLAVVLLFATIWAATQYFDAALAWIAAKPLLAAPVIVGGLIADVWLIFGLLCAGSQRCEDGKCFRTFRGRRHGQAGSPFSAFSHWVKHMERVGKVHR
jgi:hypothetical protein